MPTCRTHLAHCAVLTFRRRARLRALLIVVLAVFALVMSATPGLAWGKGHRLIRLWAVARLPGWQQELVGPAALERLCRDYTSLQDQHAGGKAPELDAYCVIPGVRVSLHDVNPPEPSAAALQWYLQQITQALHSGQTDEAMKFLGVLCHWNEDPGCPSAHSSPIDEWQLKTLLPPPKDKERFNYLYGAGGIADVGRYELPDVPYQPQLLGQTPAEAALRIYQHQRRLRQQAAPHIIPIVQDMMHGDGRKADEHRALAALDNGRHTADVIYTALCLATNRFDDHPPVDQQPLTDWLPEFRSGRVPHPYYVTPFLVNQSMDAERRLHPLALAGDQSERPIAAGYGMGVPFSLEFVLAPGGVFDRFTCRVGLHPTAGPTGAVQFAVVVNEQELTRTPWVTSGMPGVSVDVTLPAEPVLRLSLRTIPGAESTDSHNLAVWGDPILWRRN